jgi:drug/metabolite transporter (DMT)-like permease
MLWVLLVLTGAAANAGYYIATKKMLRSIHPHVLAAGSFLATALFLLIIAFQSGLPVIGDRFLFAVAITTSLNIIATILTYRALATTDISLAIPMISFTPVFLIGTSFLVLHELPTIGGVIGILIIVSGSYVLNLSPEQQGIADPFRSISRHPGVLYMLIVAFLYAITVNFDKMVMQESDMVFGSAIVCLVIGSAFVIITLFSCRDTCTLQRIKKDFSVATEPKPTSRGCLYCRMAGVFIFIGTLLTIEAIVINYAYTLQIVPYVISFKRMSIIFIVLSGAIVFHEPDIGRRLVGAGLMVLGAILILVTL